MFQSDKKQPSTFIHRHFPIMAESATEAEDDEEFVTHFLWLIVDQSGSMLGVRQQVYAQLHSIFTGLTKVNAASTDMRTRIKLALFNSTIKNFNKLHMDPEQLTTTFSETDYPCTGTTHGGAVFEYIDKELSGSSPVVKKLKKNTPKFTFIIVSDAKLNDNSGVRAAAKRLLDANHYYRNYCRVLVIFLGEEQDKATAVAMAGGKEENVVAITDDLTELLAPVIIGSTVTFPDGTHLGGSDNQSMADLTNNARSRTMDGSTSANDLNDDELHKKLLQLMGADNDKKNAS